jgi:hypothetical protein
MRTGFTGFTGWKIGDNAAGPFHPVHPVHPVCFPRRIVAELDALLPTILDRAFKGEL